MVSSSRGDTSKGDFQSYDHPDRNLVINWTDDSRGDGAAIRDADVNAKNITINTDFAGNQWTDKGIISEGTTRIKATGDISVTSHDDAVFTEGNGTAAIEGFKNLTIGSTAAGYGIVDNGGGVTVKGGEGSTVTIATDGSRPAVGNSIMTILGGAGVGKGVSISADKIKIASSGDSIFAGKGMAGETFTVTLNAKEVDVTGTVDGDGGNIDINPDTDGTVKIAAVEGDTEPAVRLGHFTGTGKMTVNKGASGVVQIDGGIALSGTGTSFLANMTGDGSYLNTRADGMGGGVFTKDAIKIESGGEAVLNMSGHDSYIRGDVLNEAGKITINAAGNNFSLRRSYLDTEAAVKAGKKGTTDILISGDNGTVEGGLESMQGGAIRLAMSGKNAIVKGDMKTVINNTDSSGFPEDNAAITADFSGKNAKMTGNIAAQTGASTIDVNFTGADGTLTGDVSSTGTEIGISSGSSPWVWTVYDKNVVNLNLTGEHTAHVGNIKTEGDNTLNANYTGRGSSLTGNVINNGVLNLTVDNGSVMTGNMSNGTTVYHNSPAFDGKMKAGFAGGSTWNGNLTVTAGTADIGLTGGSVWTGVSTGRGDITVADTSRWNVAADSEAGSLNLGSADAVVSLAGAAEKLRVNNLNGTGTFLMDLIYQDNAVDTYRSGSGSDYLIAAGGNGGTHRITLTSDSSVNGMTTDSKLYFATTAQGSSLFNVNQSVQVQNFKKIYNKNLIVKKETDSSGPYAGYDNWLLTADGTNDKPVNPNGEVPGTAYHAAAALWRSDDTLLKRLGELRYNEQNEGMWVRFHNMGLNESGRHAFRGNYKMMQLGVDLRKETKDSGYWYYGGAVEHLWGHTDYTAGSGSEKMTDFSFYGTNIRKHGHYLDLVAKVGRIDSDYTTVYGDSGRFRNWGTSISAEYGRKKVFAGNWAVEPQVQLTYSYLWGDDYTTRNGTKVGQDNTDSLVGRLGFVLSKKIHTGSKDLSRFYVKASILHDFLGDTGSRISDDIVFTDNHSLGGTWYVIGCGTNIHLEDNKLFYFDAERSFGGDIKMKYRFNTGLRFEF